MTTISRESQVSVFPRLVNDLESALVDYEANVRRVSASDRPPTAEADHQAVVLRWVDARLALLHAIDEATR